MKKQCYLDVDLKSQTLLSSITPMSSEKSYFYNKKNMWYQNDKSLILPGGHDSIPR